MATHDPKNIFVKYQFVQMMSEHLSECARVFDGDLVEMLVLSVIGQNQMAQFVIRGFPEDVQSLTTITLTAAGIADAANIPRETVRRKLQKMAQKGWIVQSDDQSWQLAIEDGRIVADEVLKDLFDKGVDKAKKMAVAIKPHL